MTASETLLTKINANLFFSEFTFAQNQINPADGATKELADNIVWLDDLLFVYQVKGREPNAIVDAESEERWFEKKVIGVAKKQMKDTISFFETYDTLPVTNERGQLIDVSAARNSNLIKIVIYEPNSDLLESKRRMMFIESSVAGLIHLFHIEDYHLICDYLLTPAELGEYLEFRMDLYAIHGEGLKSLSESYLLGHFFTTPDTAHLNPAYEYNLKKLEPGSYSSDIKALINNFKEKLVMFSGSLETDYHYIIREIAKLKRQEFKAFMDRFKLAFRHARENIIILPSRFALPRTGCGFVFCSITKEKSANWENALINFTAGFKYKHRLPKCIGVIIFTDGPYYEVRWTYQVSPWKYDVEMEAYNRQEDGLYNGGNIELLERYRFKN